MIRSRNISFPNTLWTPIRDQQDLDEWQWIWIQPGANLYLSDRDDTAPFTDGVAILFGRIFGPFLLRPGVQLYGRRPSGTSDARILTSTAGPHQTFSPDISTFDPGPPV